MSISTATEVIMQVATGSERCLLNIAVKLLITLIGTAST